MNSARLLSADGATAVASLHRSRRRRPEKAPGFRRRVPGDAVACPLTRGPAAARPDDMARGRALRSG